MPGGVIMKQIVELAFNGDFVNTESYAIDSDSKYPVGDIYIDKKDGEYKLGIVIQTREYDHSDNPTPICEFVLTTPKLYRLGHLKELTKDGTVKTIYKTLGNVVSLTETILKKKNIDKNMYLINGIGEIYKVHVSHNDRYVDVSYELVNDGRENEERCK